MKTRKYRSVIILLACALLGQEAHAQKEWSLGDCINQALKSNLTVKLREQSLKTAKADHFQSKMGLLPNLNGQATHNYSKGFSINPITNQAIEDATFRSNNFALTSSMTVFAGFQNANNVRLQESNVKANEGDVRATQNTVVLNVSNAYLTVLMNEEILKAREYQITTTREQLKRQEKLYEYGGSNKVKVLQLRAQAANEELQVITAQNQLLQSYLVLWQTINIAPDTNNKLTRPFTDSISVEDEARTADQIYETYTARSPELDAAKQRLRSSQLNEFIAVGGRSPRLIVSAGLNSFYTTQSLQPSGLPTYSSSIIGFDQFNNPIYSVPFPQYSSTEVVGFSSQFNRNLGKSLGFTLSVPIFNGWQVNTNVQKARINQETARINQQQTELDLYKNITQSYLDFKASQKQYESSMENYSANKEANDLANQQLSLGAISTNDYVTTRNLFLSAETSLVQAKYQLLFRRKVLDFYLGKPLY